MNISRVKLVFFSPTGTTKQVLEGIARGFNAVETEQLDLTPPQVKEQNTIISPKDLVILGAPVYGGRIPQTATERIGTIMGNNTPAIVVVVYGNREFEDALLELGDLALRNGFRLIAGGAFIGEHSFSSVTLPIAAGRPDAKDLQLAEQFGNSIKKKLQQFVSAKDIQPIKLPGNYPYRKVGKPSWNSPATRDKKCITCGQCHDACPMGAIIVNQKVITADTCIYCCACVKKCPTGARFIEDLQLKQSLIWIYNNYSMRKKPQWFI